MTSIARGAPKAALLGNPSRVYHRRVVQLHVADLQTARRIGREPSSDVVGLRERERERLLGEHREARLEPGRHRGSVGTRGQDEQPVQVWRPHDLLDRAESPVGCDLVPVADGRRERRREVGDRADLERVTQSLDEREMDGLRHRPEPGDPEADAAGGRAGLGLGRHERRVYREAGAVGFPS